MPNFLDLPRELRDQIYGFHLGHGTVAINTTKKFLDSSYGQLKHIEEFGAFVVVMSVWKNIIRILS